MFDKIPQRNKKKPKFVFFFFFFFGFMIGRGEGRRWRDKWSEEPTAAGGEPPGVAAAREDK